MHDVKDANTSLHLPPAWVGKKIYYKGQEFLDVERKKHRSIYTDSYCGGDKENDNPCDLVPLTPQEIDLLMRMVRFEVEFKSQYLSRYDMTTINDIPKLIERFDNEKK